MQSAYIQMSAWWRKLHKTGIKSMEQSERRLLLVCDSQQSAAPVSVSAINRQSHFFVFLNHQLGIDGWPSDQALEANAVLGGSKRSVCCV